MSDIKYIAYDSETGGINAKNSSILTLYIAALDANLNVVRELDLKLQPDSGIFQVHPKALEVNKIDIAKHVGPGVITYSQAKNKVLSWFIELGLKASDPMDYRNNNAKPEQLGYNIGFDQEFIFEHLMSKEDWERFVSYRKLDGMDAVRFLKYQGKLPLNIGSLGSVAKHLGLAPSSDLHNAKVDTLLTIEVIKALRSL